MDNMPKETNGTPMTQQEMISRSIQSMTDREIAEETLYWLRQAGQALAQFQNGGMGSMMSQMIGGMFKGKS